jgi:hypothetical protein
VAAYEEREPAKHLLLYEVGLVRDKFADSVGELFIVGHAGIVLSYQPGGELRWAARTRFPLVPTIDTLAMSFRAVNPDRRRNAISDRLAARVLRQFPADVAARVIEELSAVSFPPQTRRWCSRL